MRKTVGTCMLLLAITACTTKLGYLEKGNALVQQGKYEEATINYQKAIQKDRKYGEAYFRLGLLAMRKNDAQHAYDNLFVASQLLPNNVDVKETFAEFCLDLYLKDPNRPQSLYRQIQESASELLSIDPNSFQGLNLKGSLAHEERKPDDAISYFRRALKVRPGNAHVTAELVQTLFETGRSPEAEKTALELISRGKTYGPTYDVLYTFYSNANRNADAENILKLKVANNPTFATYRLQLARHYLRLQKSAEMQAELQKLLDDPKDFPQAQLLVGDFYFTEKDYPQAIRYYQAAERSNPKDKVGVEKKALAAMLAGSKFDDAMSLADQILKQSPDDEVALRLRADLLVNTGKRENGALAVKILQNLQVSHSNQPDPALQLNLGRAYRLKGDLGASRAAFEQAVRERKDFPAAQYELCKIYLAERKPAEALQAANAVVAMVPSNRQGLLLQARVLANAGQADKARVILDQLIKQSPKDTQARYQMGLLYMQQGKFVEAVGNLQDLSASGDIGATTALASAYVGLRKFDKAQVALSDALKQSPTSIPIRAQIARTTALSGDYNLAIVQFKNLIAQQPKSSPLQLALGDVYQAKGDVKSALASYQEAHRLTPNELTPALILADTLAVAGRDVEAKTLYHQIVKSHPDDAPALNNAAYFFSDHGELDEAQRLAEQALEKQPGQPGFSDTLGYVYLKKGQRDNAIRTFSDLVRRYPGISVFHYHLGLALYQNGDQVAAKKELQRALASHPRSNLEPSIKELLGKLS
jgi:tetratricopeptide (TPR) repeat protein